MVFPKKTELPKKPYYGPQPMEIDTVQEKHTKAKKGQTKTKKKTDFLCYNCGKKGHYAQNCR